MTAEWPDDGRGGHALEPFPQRLMKKIEMVTESGCWIYTGWLNTYGYARVGINGRDYMAHRAMYEHHRSQIPAGLEIDHLCRVRCCLNPWHMEAVTRVENLRRGFGVPAINARKAHCPKCGGDFEARTNVLGRFCRPCHNSRIRARYHSLKEAQS